MNTVKEFFGKKDAGFYLMFTAVVFAIIGLIAYLIYHPGMFVTFVNGWIVAMLILAIAAGIVTLYKNFFGAGSIVVTIFLAIAVGMLIRDHINNLAYIYYGTGPYGEEMPGALLATLIFFGLMFIASIASAFFKIDKAPKRAANNMSETTNAEVSAT